jgi:hypothetical protein
MTLLLTLVALAKTTLQEIESCFQFRKKSNIAYQLEIDESGLVVINVVHIDESSIVIEINATVACEVHANFSFSVHDSIDRDYVGVGSSSRSIDTSYKTDILIELGGDFSKNFENVEVVDIDILETIHWADFGNVEPDYDE